MKLAICLQHDGEGSASKCDIDKSKGSVMAPFLVSKPNGFYWSSCSRNTVKKTIGSFSCLKNVQKHKKQCSGICDIPYTLTEQCQFNFGKSYRACTTLNPCQKLQCKKHTEKVCQTNSRPALKGSICGRNQHCSNWSCVVDKNTINIVHGNWGLWHSWSNRSQSCGVGVRKKIRKCDSPK
ncbi:A disintegrin and metalloproteinase with thrombospondin motifs 2-like isoform X2 [Hydractinia symbiolongicarpus]|uniref:A disintegrin and metalloproteinase with thrombospondin motifs 2-like isoform X2 n=1 Tax=Hydractinia symbiolongicarpus TaxID=13093 RepID=UPI002549EB7B|nr:A disintegrin and metalloproteinase with thrombospondin motifs 2-like isoform X2 [Hydractinia symbiolongicarpus]